MNRLIKYDIVSIDAWREQQGGWTWNAAYFVRRGIELDGERLDRSAMSVSRYLLNILRKEELIPEADRHGRLTAEMYGEDCWEIQRRQDALPLYAFQPHQ